MFPAKQTNTASFISKLCYVFKNKNNQEADVG